MSEELPKRGVIYKDRHHSIDILKTKSGIVACLTIQLNLVLLRVESEIPHITGEIHNWINITLLSDLFENI